MSAPRAASGPRLVVATTSRYRLALLDRLGIPYQAVAHRADERALEAIHAAAGQSAESVALHLGRAKAESVAGDFPDALVLGSDQLVDLDGELLGKPGDAAGALAQLVRLSGRAHRLITAVSLRLPDGSWDEHIDVHVMRMRELSPAQLSAYVAKEEPYDCAGSYKIEGLGIALMDAMHGPDYTGIMGLPLTCVVAMLARAGLDVLLPPR